MCVHTYIGQLCSVAIWAQACLPQQLAPNPLAKEIGLVVDHPISFLSFVRPLPSAADVRHMDRELSLAHPLPSAADVRRRDREICPPSSTLVRNTTERKAHTATCTPQPIRQATLKTGRIPLGHRVPIHQSPPADLSPRGRTHHGSTLPVDRSPEEPSTGESQGTKSVPTLQTPPVDLSPRSRTHHGSTPPVDRSPGELSTGVGRRVCQHSYCSHLLPLERPNVEDGLKDQVQSSVPTLDTRPYCRDLTLRAYADAGRCVPHEEQKCLTTSHSRSIYSHMAGLTTGVAGQCNRH
jgi:hypothetical protein